ncbi:hypothetical protein K1719_017815 [Acacia pycnantha]|nr:hypothetical protein K1719_017815 [Acacia pycnantha]
MSRKLTAVRSLKAELEVMDHSEFLTAQSCCIYRVPPQLREVNEAAYTPVIVSIGPLHHGNKRLNSMEEVKLWFLHKFLKRTHDRSFEDDDSPNGYSDDSDPIELVTYDYFYSAFMHNIVPNQELRENFTFEYFEQYHLPRHPDGTQVYHLCDMLRICYVPLDQLPREYNHSKPKHVYSACKLHDAGIKFEVKKDELSLLELQYSKGVLKIPEIMICDSTETHLRNVVAFEQCHFRSSRSMTDYMVFWEHFIRTERDVEILEEKGIIQNLVGENDAVASITKRLARNTYYRNYNNDYISLVKELNELCDSPYQRYKAIFKEQYWSTPWRIASFLGGILLLVLTLIQTISSVIALFQN